MTVRKSAPKGKTPKKTAKTEKTSRPASAYRTLQTLIIRDPSLNIEQLAERMEKEGFTIGTSTIRTTRNSIISVLKIIEQLRK